MKIVIVSIILIFMVAILMSFYKVPKKGEKKETLEAAAQRPIFVGEHSKIIIDYSGRYPKITVPNEVMTDSAEDLERGRFENFKKD